MTAAAALHPRNAVTYLALLLGLVAVIAALDNRQPAAGIAIAVAVLADTFDGRYARLFRSDAAEAALGAELDSLSDACSFGLAPVVWVLSAAPGGPSATLSIAAFAYLAATVTRLAVFNVTSPTFPGFVGLPAPAGALIVTTAVAFGAGPAASAGVVVLTAAAMVSPCPLRRPTGPGLALFACWPLALVWALAWGH
jgi:CDP-diacylglycerol--serine O-phosphatidyltransferase